MMAGMGGMMGGMMGGAGGAAGGASGMGGFFQRAFSGGGGDDKSGGMGGMDMDKLVRLLQQLLRMQKMGPVGQDLIGAIGGNAPLGGGGMTTLQMPGPSMSGSMGNV